jgi:hypothetical protein
MAETLRIKALQLTQYRRSAALARSKVRVPVDACRKVREASRRRWRRDTALTGVGGLKSGAKIGNTNRTPFHGEILQRKSAGKQICTSNCFGGEQ